MSPRLRSASIETPRAESYRTLLDRPRFTSSDGLSSYNPAYQDKMATSVAWPVAPFTDAVSWKPQDNLWWCRTSTRLQRSESPKPARDGLPHLASSIGMPSGRGTPRSWLCPPSAVGPQRCWLYHLLSPFTTSQPQAALKKALQVRLLTDERQVALAESHNGSPRHLARHIFAGGLRLRICACDSGSRPQHPHDDLRLLVAQRLHGPACLQ